MTDIGNSIAYTGRVVDGAGNGVAAARVVAYYDNWQFAQAADSVETVSDESGAFKISVDSTKTVLLYASLGESCGFTDPALASSVDDGSLIAIGSRKTYSGNISGRLSGSVRIVGSDASASLDSEGRFSFSDVPRGDVTIAYSDSSANENIRSRAVFTITGEQEVMELPELSFVEEDTTWMAVSLAAYYADGGFGGIRFYEPETESWSVPESASAAVEPLYTKTVAVPAVSGAMDGFMIPVVMPLEAPVNSENLAVLLVNGTDTTKLSSEVEYENLTEAMLWVRLAGTASGDSLQLLVVEDSALASAIAPLSSVEALDGVVANLHLNGDANIFNNDSTAATSVADSAGLFGNGVTLSAGQFIDLDTLNPTGADFTISLWTKWNGTNGHHQILVSQRAYWSDSTSRFQWHFEKNENWFAVMKSMPGYPAAVYMADSSAVPQGEWANLVLVSENHMVRMYVNGRLLYTSDDEGNAQYEYEFVPNELSRSVPFRIGGNEINDETWNGAFDEIRIETVARSDEWVRAQYKAMKP